METQNNTLAAGQTNEGEGTKQSGQAQTEYSTTAQKMAYTVWLNNSGTRKTEKRQTWLEFCEWLENLPPAVVKDDCQLIKLARFGETRTPLRTLSDGKKTGNSLRSNANVLEVTGIEGDYDSEEMAHEQAVTLLEQHQLKAAIVPTFSDSPGAPRWRVLTPLKRPIRPKDRLRYAEVLNGMLGGVLANESKTLSQSFYIGVPESAPYNVLHTFDDPDEGLTLDELDEQEGIDQYRQPFKNKKQRDDANGESFSDAFDDSDINDWMAAVLSGDEIHPNLIKAAGRLVAKGWKDEEIHLFFTPYAERVESERGKERADLLRGTELEEAIASARAKGWAPREYAEILADANALTKESDPDAIDSLIAETIPLKAIQKRQVRQAIKKATGLPFSVMEEAERANFDDEGTDDLQLARGLASEIGRDNVLAAQSFAWKWHECGVWKKQDERTVKQWVQNYIGDKAGEVRKSNVDSVADLFRTEIYMPQHAFDVGPVECVNTLNGELMLADWGQWELMPHTRTHYRTTQVPVEYDHKAEAPQFVKFLADVFKGDPDAGDKATAVLEMMGYTLMAHSRHEKFIILVGSGANGKSVLLKVLEALAGRDNVAAVQPSQFHNKFQRAHLHNKLANIVSEIKEGAVIDDDALKGITSGESSTVEHKNKDPFDMRPFSTCWFGTNHMPNTRDFSGAMFRRAMVLQFNNTFKPELGNCDPNLTEKLIKELPGILTLALDAYADALIEGFTMPQSCVDAREEWRLNADQVAQFVDVECEATPDAQTPSQAMYEAYKEWAKDSGIHNQLAIKSFKERMERLGFKYGRNSTGRFYSGVRCKRAVVF
ncbi:phage/plasmid primase, P4 family [Marinobacter nauticus]